MLSPFSLSFQSSSQSALQCPKTKDAKKEWGMKIAEKGGSVFFPSI